ncbi:MAG: hypothetical protein DRO04_01705 [Candidatus Iainarchaeum archaeon]|uniref:Uncharacterized protein n=1 Tax=Candidatus Iainarchaeum sp. TaxID=3101447 RepID=A0A497JIT6_9ARCH|nr:MAG: hypothetical protein DRO04_01705 [Candidatus Diapherotrites archaeon]
MATVFGSVDGVKAILRSAPPGGQAFIKIPDHISEARVTELLEFTADLMIRKIGFEPKTNATLREINNYLTAYHIYLEAWSSAGQFDTGIPEQIQRWHDFAWELLEDSSFIASLEPETAAEAVAPSAISNELIRIQDEAIMFKSSGDSFVAVTPVLENSEILRSGKRGTGTLYQRGVDYYIWPAEGRLRRIESGSIPLNTTLYITYYAVREREFLEDIEDELEA